MALARLGDYIKEVDIRNKDLKVTNLLGLSIKKQFISSIANTIGTDMSVYKIIKKDQFAYVPVTSRNGEKITIALLEEDNAIISQAYTIFEITDKEKLLPQYLMMCFRKSEFDRYARFHSHGSAREIFDYQNLCDTMIEIPSMEEQKEIVDNYEILTKRIELNKQIIANLESTAQTLYKKMFVDDIDKENLPSGWRLGTLGDIAECLDYKRKPLSAYERIQCKKIYPYYGAATLMDYVEDYIFEGSYILMGEDGTVINNDNTPVIQYVTGKFWVNNHAHVLKGVNEFDENLLYIILKQTEVNEYITGGVQAKINQENMMSIPVLIPPIDVVKGLKSAIAPLFDKILHAICENEKLKKLQELLLTKI